MIPKEIRRTLRIREGDPLEIFTDREGEIILKKYSPIGELSAFAQHYAQSLAQTLGCLAAVCDMDQIVAVAGPGKKELEEQYISRELEKILMERKHLLHSSAESKLIKITAEQEGEYTSAAIHPILCEGDVIGGVLLLTKDDKKKFTLAEQKAAGCAADFLGRQMEQ